MAFKDFIGPTAQVVAIVATAAGGTLWLADLRDRVSRLEKASEGGVRVEMDKACADLLRKVSGYTGRPNDADTKPAIDRLEKLMRDWGCPSAKAK